MIFLLITSLFLGTSGAIAVSRYGQQLGFLDTPNHRSSHSTPTPKGGGVGILFAFILVSLMSLQSVFFWLPACVVSFVGMYGDRTDISPASRLLIQLTAAAFFVIYFTISRDSPPTAYFVLPCWAIFIVGTANFYNFMDGINGIAGITGVVGFGLMGLFLHSGNGSGDIVLVCFCLCAACAGFLPLNMPSAKVFMGDIGSILLGFIFAMLVYLSSSSFIDFLCFASLLFPFYIDELSTMIIRLRNGDRLSQAHRKHLYQIIANERGVAHWKISLCYGILQLIVGAGVFMARPYGIPAVLLLLFICSALFVSAGYRIRLNSR